MPAAGLDDARAQRYDKLLTMLTDDYTFAAGLQTVAAAENDQVPQRCLPQRSAWLLGWHALTVVCLSRLGHGGGSQALLTILRIFECQGKALDFTMSLINRELTATSDRNLLFRLNSLATKGVQRFESRLVPGSLS